MLIYLKAFLAVLRIRFKNIRSEKLERSEFLLSDEKQNLNLDRQCLD